MAFTPLSPTNCGKASSGESPPKSCASTYGSGSAPTDAICGWKVRPAYQSTRWPSSTSRAANGSGFVVWATTGMLANRNVLMEALSGHAEGG